MIEPSQLLVDNLLDAFHRLNTYLTAGLVASVSALVLHKTSLSVDEKESVVVSGFVPMKPETAKYVLVGIGVIAGFMGSYTAQSAARIVDMLKDSPDVITAACTYASIATAPLLIRFLAALLPVILVTPILTQANTRGPGAYTALVLFAGPYCIMGFILAREVCQ